MTWKYYDKLAIKAPGMDANILTLSGGNQQKVIVAKWLATNLNILFLDEPTRGIDVGTKQELYSLIIELAKNGMSVVVISSEMRELIGVCDRFLVLSKGKLKAVLDKKDVSEAKLLHYCSNL